MLELSHKKLEIYKIALQLMKDVYNITNKLPNEEKFVLVPQLRRATISVCSNLAEGAARISPKEKKRFYEVARSSVVEIDSQIEISIMLGYIDRSQTIEIDKNLESVFRMLSKMIGNIAPNPLTKNH